MEHVQDAYNQWSEQYDSNSNKTRDLEAVAIRQLLHDVPFSACLELGCGTGKNTEWLVGRADKIMAVDFSDKMLDIASEKIKDEKLTFVLADLLQPWTFIDSYFDLISFSLVLEHIENLDDIFKKAAAALQQGGYMYIGELHTFKQYQGTKARFETAAGTQILSCYLHHLSDYLQAADKHGFNLIKCCEFFDDNDRTGCPRILGLLFKRW